MYHQQCHVLDKLQSTITRNELTKLTISEINLFANYKLTTIFPLGNVCIINNVGVLDKLNSTIIGNELTKLTRSRVYLFANLKLMIAN